MISLIQHLFLKLGEEASEVVQDVSKGLIFGMEDVNVKAPDGPTVEERLIIELNDLIAVVGLLVETGALRGDWFDEQAQQLKQIKTLRYAAYARSLGMLTADSWSMLQELCLKYADRTPQSLSEEVVCQRDALLNGVKIAEAEKQLTMCPECQQPIRCGEMVHIRESGEFAHVTCPEALSEVPADAEKLGMCPACALPVMSFHKQERLGSELVHLPCAMRLREAMRPTVDAKAVRLRSIKKALKRKDGVEEPVASKPSVTLDEAKRLKLRDAKRRKGSAGVQLGYPPEQEPSSEIQRKMVYLGRIVGVRWADHWTWDTFKAHVESALPADQQSREHLRQCAAELLAHEQAQEAQRAQEAQVVA